MVKLIELIGEKFFSKDGTIELSPYEAKKDAGSFILAILLAILSLFFFNQTVAVLLSVGVYIFLRFKQRGPFSSF